MQDVRDLAQVAETATTVANESVNVVKQATSDEQTVTIQDIVKTVCKDGRSCVITTSITNIDCETRTSKNGNEYLNAFITISDPVIGAQKMPDGTRRLGAIGAIQMPFNSLLLVMRKDKFYGRFTNYVGEAAELGFASMYVAGVEIKVLCQFVAAGEQSKNPFTRKDNLYDVVDYDRYVYHVVGIEQPKDPVVVNAYQALIKQIMDDARAAIIAKREAKAKTANLVSAISMDADDVPF